MKNIKFNEDLFVEILRKISREKPLLSTCSFAKEVVKEYINKLNKECKE